MKTRIMISAISAAAILIVLAIALNINASGQRSKDASDAQWEYLIVAGGNINFASVSDLSTMRKQPEVAFNREASVIERNMDKLGAKGWELVAVHGAPNDPVYYFRRLK